MAALNLLQLSDLHILEQPGNTMLGIDTEHYFSLTLRHAQAAHGPFDLILLTGDLAQDPSINSYRRIAENLQSYRTPCLCLPGNHDDFTAMQTVFKGDLINCNRRVQLPGWQIIALNSQIPDSPVGRLAEQELQFLEDSLSAEPKLPTLLAMHHPCIASGSPWLDTMQIENSAALLEMTQRFDNIKAMVCGHIHQELTAWAGKIPVYTTPSTCFQFTPRSREFSIDDRPPGYRILNLNADGSLRTFCDRIPEALTTLDRNAHGY